MFTRIAAHNWDTSAREVRIAEFSAVRRSFAAWTLNASPYHSKGTRIAVSAEGETLNKFKKRIERAGWRIV